MTTKKGKTTSKKTSKTCRDCGSSFVPSPYAPHSLYCKNCTGKKHDAFVPTGVRKCASCHVEFTPTGPDAWQVKRCEACRAKRLAAHHAKIAARKAEHTNGHNHTNGNGKVNHDQK